MAGDNEAFRVLLERYANSIYRAVYGVLQSAKDAEDVTQDVFVQILLSMPKYERKGLKTWMTRIAINKAIDWKRKLVRRKEQELPEQIDGLPAWSMERPPDTERVIADKERRQRITQSIQELPPPFREVIVAYYLEEKSYQQIATQLEIEIKTVESRLYRAKQWMRKHWKEADFE